MQAIHSSRHNVPSSWRTAAAQTLQTRCTLPGCRAPASRQVKCYGQWLEIGAESNVPTPRSFAYQLFQDRARIPEFMNWIKEVQVINATDSKWKLQQEAFGQVWNLSWVAEDLPPIKYQKIHWKSIPGSMEGSAGIEVANSGEVRFTKTAADTCKVKIGVQFEVPEPLIPFAVLLVPLADGILLKDMQKFAEYASAKYVTAKAAAAS